MSFSSSVITLCKISFSSSVLGSRGRSSVIISQIRKNSSIVKLDRNKRSTLFTFGLGSSAAEAPSALSDDEDVGASEAALLAFAAGVDEAFAVAGAGGTFAYV